MISSVDNNTYELDFEYKNNGTMTKYANTDIPVLVMNTYTVKEINIVSKRQFREMYYNVTQDTIHLILNLILDSVEYKINILYL